MKILALDFSFDERSVAILTKGAASHAESLSEVVEAAGSAGPLAMIEQALRQAQLERAQIESIAIGLGPGSYTGIRASLALAQGWSLARPVNLTGISSVDAIATQARLEGVRGKVCVVIDAQRNEFYLAGFELSDQAEVATDGLRLASLEEVSAAERRGFVAIGPEVTKWFPHGRRILPRAGIIAWIAAARGPAAITDPLEPIYLREVSFVKAPPPRKLPE